MTHRGLNEIDACPFALHNSIVQVVHHVNVIPRTALERVGPRTTVQRVVSGVPNESVPERIACAADVGRAQQMKLLDMVSQRMGDAGEHPVVSKVTRS